MYMWMYSNKRREREKIGEVNRELFAKIFLINIYTKNVLYSLNIWREKIFADFKVFDLPQKFYLKILGWN